MEICRIKDLRFEPRFLPHDLGVVVDFKGDRTMGERKQEEAYFYQLNRELIRKSHSHPGAESSSPKTSSSVPNGKLNSLYDFLDRHLQPNENWIADI